MRWSIGRLRDMARESPDFLALAVVCVLLGMGPNPRVARAVSSVPLHMFPGCDRNAVERVRTTDRWVRFIKQPTADSRQPTARIRRGL